MRMTIDEAIEHCEKVAKENEYASKKGIWFLPENEVKDIKEQCSKCAADHRQLAEWLLDLKKAKILLKRALEDMNDNNICYDINACNVCKEQHCIQCETFKWRYTDEAERLINK